MGLIFQIYSKYFHLLFGSCNITVVDRVCFRALPSTISLGPVRQWHSCRCSSNSPHCWSAPDSRLQLRIHFLLNSHLHSSIASWRHQVFISAPCGRVSQRATRSVRRRGGNRGLRVGNHGRDVSGVSRG